MKRWTAPTSALLITAAGLAPGRSGVVAAWETPTQEVTANPDGTYTVRIDAGPVRFQDASGSGSRST